jgi:large subunit ribosomal protein L24
MIDYKMKIRKGDNVLVILGKDRGKTGLVERVVRESGKIVVASVQTAKKHVKPSKKHPSGGIIEIQMPVPASNVMLICPSCGKSTRVGVDRSKENAIRICVKCKKSIQTEVTK